MISPGFFSCHVIVKTNTWLKSLQSWYNFNYARLNDYARGIVNRSWARVMFLASKSHRTRQRLRAVITRQLQAADTVRINNH